MTARTQYRGHCQCCGRIQASDGRVAKHGYEVKDRGNYGYFQGVCSGHNYAPIEIKRDQADAVIASVKADIERMDLDRADLMVGNKHPATVRGHWDSEAKDYRKTPWAEANEYQRSDALRDAVFRVESQLRAARSFVKDFSALVDRVHGQPLTEVKLAAPAARIQAGEKRQGRDRELTAKYQEGAMVHYSYTSESTGKTFTTRMASRSWRALPLAI